MSSRSACPPLSTPALPVTSSQLSSLRPLQQTPRVVFASPVVLSQVLRWRGGGGGREERAGKARGVEEVKGKERSKRRGREDKERKEV